MTDPMETERLWIRRHAPSDWETLYSYLSLPETYEFEPGEPISEERARELARARAAGEDFLAVVEKSTGTMVGHLYFRKSEPMRFETWELGFILHPAFRNRGYCTEASAAMVRDAFERRRAHKIVAFCDPRNTASWKVLEKIGMEREGHFRQKAFFRLDGEGKPLWNDCWAYGILAGGGEAVLA